MVCDIYIYIYMYIYVYIWWPASHAGHLFFVFEGPRLAPPARILLAPEAPQNCVVAGSDCVYFFTLTNEQGKVTKQMKAGLLTQNHAFPHFVDSNPTFVYPHLMC